MRRIRNRFIILLSVCSILSFAWFTDTDLLSGFKTTVFHVRQMAGKQLQKHQEQSELSPEHLPFVARMLFNFSTSSTSVRDDDDGVGIPTSKGPRIRKLRVELVGGARLGNQIFAHASLLGIAKRNNRLPVLTPKNTRLLDLFDLKTPKYMSHETEAWPLFVERQACVYDNRTEKLNDANDLVIFGYYQSWRYFENIREEILKKFSFRDALRKKAMELLRFSVEVHYPKSYNDVRLVGIHVRRNDMLHPLNVKKGYTVANETYIRRAMEHIESKLVPTYRILYVVVSDAHPWCVENIKSSRFPVEFGPPSSDANLDLALLASCDHSIITVGTFGWWAGYLAGGMTVFYKDFPAKQSTLSEMFHFEDYFPPSWIGL